MLTYIDHLHWRSLDGCLRQKYQQLAKTISHCICLGSLGIIGTNRNNPDAMTMKESSIAQSLFATLPVNCVFTDENAEKYVNVNTTL
jgi:hypothetical protein